MKLKQKYIYLLILALASALFFGYSAIKQNFFPEPPEIFFIESKSNDVDYRFVIANPPKNGNELLKLILAHEKSMHKKPNILLQN